MHSSFLTLNVLISGEIRVVTFLFGLVALFSIREFSHRLLAL
jgi:hypothetical protein